MEVIKFLHSDARFINNYVCQVRANIISNRHCTGRLYNLVVTLCRLNKSLKPTVSF